MFNARSFSKFAFNSVSKLKLTSKQVEITKFNAEDFRIVEKPIIEIASNEAVVKVHYAPLIHYDIMKMTGITGAVLPYIPCVELSGIIEACAKKELIGRKVSYVSLKEGTLKSRIIVNLDEALILNDEVDLLNGCLMSCNPFTAVGVVETAINLGAKAFAVTTGNSNVGIQINRVAVDKGLKCISIVRSQNRVEEMKAIGQRYVLNSSSDEFVKHLNNLMGELDANVLFDSLSGPIVGKLMKGLPSNGIFVNFGTQTHEKMSGIDATDMRWGNKSMINFLVGPWIDKKIRENSFQVHKDYINSHFNIFKSDYGKVFNVKDLTSAVSYAQSKNDLLKVVIDMRSI